MKKFLLSILILFFVMHLNAQNADRDSILTNNGYLKIYPVSHATMYLTWNGKTIYVDPTGGANAFALADKPDIILVTDIHGDHMNAETIKAVKSEKTKIIAPKAVKEGLADEGIVNIEVMNNGDKITVEGITIHAIPMYNLPESEEAFHPKGRGNGYILEFGGKRIYISGDTEGIGEMRALENIDAAFVCMNLPYTMDIYQAVSAVLEFEPAIVYPYHYRGKDGYSDVKMFTNLVNRENKNIKVKLLNWYPDRKTK